MSKRNTALVPGRLTGRRKVRPDAKDLRAYAPQGRPAIGDDGAVEAGATKAPPSVGLALIRAWERYVELFGDRPHGTDPQLLTLGELLAGELRRLARSAPHKGDTP